MAAIADNDSVRSRRKRLHAQGDHSTCKSCAAVHGVRSLELVAAEPGAVVDPVAELNASAARLAEVCRSAPANIAAAHELRLTLDTLAKIGPTIADPMDELLTMVRQTP
jgi:hypothetical protein